MRMHSPIHHFFFCLCVLLCLSRGWFFFCVMSIPNHEMIWFVTSQMSQPTCWIGLPKNGPVLSLALPTKWKRFVFQFFFYVFSHRKKCFPDFYFYLKNKRTLFSLRKKVIGLLWERPNRIVWKEKENSFHNCWSCFTHAGERKTISRNYSTENKKGYEKQTCRRLLSARIYLRRIRKPRLAIKCVRPVASWLPARAQVARFVLLVEK